MQNEYKSKNIMIVDKTKKLEIRRKTIKFLKENKLFSIVLVIFLCFASINFYLIYSFMKIIQTI